MPKLFCLHRVQSCIHIPLNAVFMFSDHLILGYFSVLPWYLWQFFDLRIQESAFPSFKQGCGKCFAVFSGHFRGFYVL